MQDKKKGYQAPKATSMSQGDHPCNLFIYFHNDPEKSSGKLIMNDGDPAPVNSDGVARLISKSVFFEVCTAYRKKEYEKATERTKVETTEYRRKTDTVTVSEYGQKIGYSTVEGLAKLYAKLGTEMVVYALCWTGGAVLYRAKLVFSASSRNAFFLERFSGGTEFEIKNRETSKKERDDKWADRVYYPQKPVSTDAIDYDWINGEAVEFSEALISYGPMAHLFLPAPTAFPPVPTAPAPPPPYFPAPPMAPAPKSMDEPPVLPTVDTPPTMDTPPPSIPDMSGMDDLPF